MTGLRNSEQYIEVLICFRFVSLLSDIRLLGTCYGERGPLAAVLITRASPIFSLNRQFKKKKWEKFEAIE